MSQENEKHRQNLTFKCHVTHTHTHTCPIIEIEFSMIEQNKHYMTMSSRLVVVASHPHEHFGKTIFNQVHTLVAFGNCTKSKNTHAHAQHTTFILWAGIDRMLCRRDQANKQKLAALY